MFDLLMLRPDAIKALEDSGVKKALPRYVKVVDLKILKIRRKAY